MEPVLINICPFNKETLTEMVKTTRKASRIVITVCVVIFLLLAAVNYFLLYDVFMAIMMLFCAAFFGVFEALVPGISVKKILKRYDELHHTEIDSELHFLEDSIFSTSPQTKSESTILYPQIKKVLRSKNLYIIRIGAQLVLLVKKDGFTKGGCADFEVLMRQKATKAKIKF
jgi:hypothetical protein